MIIEIWQGATLCERAELSGVTEKNAEAAGMKVCRNYYGPSRAGTTNTLEWMITDGDREVAAGMW